MILDINKVENISIYSSLISSIERSNKYFTIPENSDVYVVNNKHTIAGIVVIYQLNSILNVEIYQPPGVCRISVLMLIEASVLISKKDYSDYSVVMYRTQLEAYKFRYKSILIDYNEEELTITSIYETIKSLSIEDITKRNIMYNGKEL